MKTRIQSLEDKLLSKMKTVKSHLLNDIFDLRNDIMLLKKKKKKKKERKKKNIGRKALLLKEKIKFESKNNFLGNGITIKQKVIDSFLESSVLSSIVKH